MHIATHILASGDDSELIKLVGIAVILIFAAIGSVVKKVREGQAPPPQARRAVPPPLPRLPARLVPTAARIVPSGATPLPPLPTLARAAKPRTATARPKAARAQAAPARPQPAAQMARLSAPTPAAPSVPAAAPVPVSSIANLLNPTTVRAQFILAEVLQPPLAIRTRKTF